MEACGAEGVDYHGPEEGAVEVVGWGAHFWWLVVCCRGIMIACCVAVSSVSWLVNLLVWWLFASCREIILGEA